MSDTLISESDILDPMAAAVAWVTCEDCGQTTEPAFEMTFDNGWICGYCRHAHLAEYEENRR